MRSHLKVHHPLQFAQLIAEQPSQPSTSTSFTQPQQLTIAESFNRTKKYPKNSNMHNKITDSITKYLAMDCLPIYSVEKQGFKQLVSVLTESKYDIPSRNHFAEMAVPKLYNDTRMSVMADLSQSDFYSATTDIWSSIGLYPYISLTIHFISKNWNLETRVLETYPMPQDHTASNISEIIEDMLQLWQIEKKQLVSLTTDNAANMKLAGSLLKITRVPCFGHLLHNAINFALTEDKIERALGACRKMSGRLGMSFKKKRELAKIQRELKLPVKVIPSDNNTRWNSKFKLLCYCIEQEDALRSLFNDRATYHLIPSPAMFQVNRLD